MWGLGRLTLLIVPVEWRETVERDLAEEAGRRGLSRHWADLWMAAHTVRIGVAFWWRAGSRTPGLAAPSLTVGGAIDRVRVDLHHTWRALSARRGASLGTVVVLTVGIGLTSAIFALTDPFLLRPLPYRDPARLVVIEIGLGAGRSPLGFSPLGPDVPTLADWQRRTDLFQEIAAYGPLERVRLTTPAGGASLRVRTVSPNLLSTLSRDSVGAPAARPTPPAAPRQLVASETLARVRLGLDAGNLTTVLRTDDDAYVDLVATLPAGFMFPSRSLAGRPDVLSPIDFGPVVWARGQSRDWLTGVARLQPGVTPDLVRAALERGLTSSGLALTVQPLDAYLAADMRPLALGALATGLMIALVSTANVMNLLVARGIYRARDFATRHALGASRLDLLRLVILELAALGGAAAGASLLVAHVGLGAIADVTPAAYSVIGQPGVTPRVVVFTLLLVSATVLACAVPAWLSAWSSSSAALGHTRQDEPRAARRWRFVLTVGQTTIAMALLVGATFLVQSYANLWTQATGYAPEARLVSVSYPRSATGAQLVETLPATLAALRRVPGIVSVAAGVGVGPLLDGYGGGGGPTIRAGEHGAMMMPSQVTAGYFDVVGMPILAGRALAASDRGWDAVVVNQAFVRRFWPDATAHDVIGRSLTANGIPGLVVGVAHDTHDRALDLAPAPHLYKPLESYGPLGRLTFAIRLATDGAVPESAIRQVVAGVYAGAIVEVVDSVSGRLSETVRDRTFATLVLVTFAAAGLGVTAAGIFAVVAFVAARRTREIAIRVALGAGASQVRGLVIRDAVAATLTGGLVGLAASRFLAKTIESQFYGVTASDWATPALAVAGLVAVSALAAWWPMTRALRVDPTVALRVE